MNATQTAGARDRLLTVAEVCAQLRISRWTFYQLLNQRRLATIKIGSRRLIPATSVDALIRDLLATANEGR